MSPTLTFYCPACSARLTVPAQLAGVTGPCPTCGTTIRAPQPAPAPSPVPTAPPQQAPPQPVPQPYAPPRQIPHPPAQAPPAYPPSQPSASAPEAPGHVVRVEPRNFRQKDPHEISAKPITEQLLRESGEYRPPSPDKRGGPLRVKRILISLIALLFMAGVSAGLIHYLSGTGKETPGAPRTKEILPDTPIPAPDIPDRPLPAPVTPSPAPAPPPKPDPEPVAPPAESVPAIPPKVPVGVAAADVLEKFLEAKTLGERLPLIETTLDLKTLESTVLAGPLPADPIISADIQESNRADDWMDIYFNVELKDEAGKYRPYLVLLRSHAGGEPKVVVSPFLDTYGGRLAAYASTPSDKAAIFQVVASAVARTTSDQKIPNHEQKLWLKLLPRDNEKEIAGAFFTKGSPIGRMLTDDTSGFRYGQARPVKVQVRWNTQEDPNQPYLEAVDIKELRWSP